MSRTPEFRPGIDRPGRPDFNCTLSESEQFWWSEAKSFKPFVHGSSRNCCLVHRASRVKIRWYEGCNGFMHRLEHPDVYAETICGQHFFLTVPKKSAKMCSVPDVGAIQCGRCNGEIPTFSKKRKVRVTRQYAKDHLSCFVDATEAIA